jgi:hypothetical protein
MLFAISAIYLIAGLYLLSYFQYQLNPDGVSYISIAQKYSKLNFNDAVNGYWGPLFSWLMIPFILSGLSTIMAAKILSLAIGLSGIVAIWSFSYKFGITEWVRNLILTALIPFILYSALSLITPDLLLMCILITYFNIIFSKNYPASSSKALMCGILGGVAYLSKGYAFPFFIMHFTLFNILHFYRDKTYERKKLILKNFFLGFIVFSLIAGSWIFVLSHKYHRIVITTAGSFNYGGLHPDLTNMPENEGTGLIKPPNESAIHTWEDPSYFETTLWNPFQSWQYFQHSIYIILKNIYDNYLIYIYISPLSVVVIFFCFFSLVYTKSVQVIDNKLFFPLITLMLYPIGYWFTAPVFSHRLIWVNNIILILMGGYLFNAIFKNTSIDERTKKIAFYIFLITFMIMPMRDLYHDIREKPGKYVFDLSESIKKENYAKGNIASNGNLAASLFISFHLNTPYYGIPNLKQKQDLLSELKKNNIDYYFVWKKHDTDCSSQIFNKHRDITVGKLPELKIYSLK